MLIEIGTDMPDVNATCTRLQSNPQKKGERDDKCVTDTVAALTDYENKFRDDQMDRQKDFRNQQQYNGLDRDWLVNVNIGVQYVDRRQEILDMPATFQQIWDGRLSRIDMAKYRIDLASQDVRLVNSASYRAGPETRKIEMIKIDKMLHMNVREPAHCEWSSLTLFAPKKDGSLHFCIDYRKLNAVNFKEACAILQIDCCLGLLGQSHIVSTLDASSGVCQFVIADREKNETMFTSHHGLK